MINNRQIILNIGIFLKRILSKLVHFSLIFLLVWLLSSMDLMKRNLFELLFLDETSLLLWFLFWWQLSRSFTMESIYWKRFLFILFISHLSLDLLLLNFSSFHLVDRELNEILLWLIRFPCVIVNQSKKRFLRWKEKKIIQSNSTQNNSFVRWIWILLLHQRNSFE